MATQITSLSSATDVDSSVNELLQSIDADLSKVNTALIGKDGKTNANYFSDLIEIASDAGSAYVKSSDYLKELVSLSEKGQLENLESRALLSTISDRLVNGFNLENENLVRLIQIQDVDSTLAEMGVRSEITAILNSTFSDSRYMTSLYESTYNALFDTLADSTASASSEIEFTIQKWLGSLYSAGVDSATITNLTTALNKLGSHDTSLFTSDSSTLTLLELGAQVAGVDLSSALSSIDAETLNSLLSGIVQYIQEIDNSGYDSISETQLANVLGLSLGNIKAIASLDTTKLDTIRAYQTTYEDSTNWILDNLEGMLDTNTSLVDKYNNLIENWEYTQSSELYSSGNLNTYLIEDYLANMIGENTLGNALEIAKSVTYLTANNEASDEADLIDNLIAGTSSAITSVKSLFSSLFSLAANQTSSTGVSNLVNALTSVYGVDAVSDETGFKLIPGITHSYSQLFNAINSDNASTEAISYIDTSTNNATSTTSVSESSTITSIESLATQLFSGETEIGIKLNSLGTNAISQISSLVFNTNISSIGDTNHEANSALTNDIYSAISSSTPLLSGMPGISY